MRSFKAVYNNNKNLKWIFEEYSTVRNVDRFMGILKPPSLSNTASWLVCSIG